MWAMILEKAFSKYLGNIDHKAGQNLDLLWDKLVEADGKNHMITAGSYGDNDKDTNADGLVQGHAYSVISTHKLSNGVRLLKLRNPWGSDSFKGRWSDNSGLWTDEFKKEVGFKQDLNDGFVFMQLEDYQKQFESTSIN